MKTSKGKCIRRNSITSGTREWADHNINCIKGCSNNCRYCYAKLMAKRFGRCSDKTWSKMIIRNEIINSKFVKYQGRVMFPSSHDIIDSPKAKDACFIVIQRLLEAGNSILITTKPRLSITKDIISEFSSLKSQIQFRFTITSLYDRLLSFWEPGAPTFEERFSSLKYAYKAGIRTSISIEPFLDWNPRVLIEALIPFVTETIWLGPMNYIPINGITEKNKRQYEEIRINYSIERLRELYEDLRIIPIIRFKDSLINRLKFFSPAALP